MNHTLRSQPPANASFTEVMDAVDQNFADACTLFELSWAMKNPLLRDCYIKTMDQAMSGEVALDQAVKLILELAR